LTETPQTVAETSHYLRKAEKLLSVAEREEVVLLVATEPKCGALLQGTGGVRKVRVAVGGRGKSGGARVVYFFHNENIPIYLLTIFAKNERSNLTKQECNDLRKLTRALVQAYGEQP